MLPLAAGAVYLIAFVLWARWDGVFRDRPQLSMPRFLWVPVAAFTIGTVLHFVFVSWGQLTPDLLLAILVTGVLVGFCEETLFRGILLRGFRANGRSEAIAAIGTSVLFGLFHLTNVINGSPLQATLTQVLLATLTGAILYTFRRFSGLLVVAMMSHSLWDISLFFPAMTGSTAVSLTTLAASKHSKPTSATG